MFPLSVGDYGRHRNQGKVRIADVTTDSVYFTTSSGDTIRISAERAIEMIVPIGTVRHAPASSPPSNPSHHSIPSSNEITASRRLTSTFALNIRPYQTEALKALTAAFRLHSKVILALPTGSGKTFVAVKWLCDHVLHTGGTVVWVAHRTELLSQAYATFLKLLPPHLASEVTWWAGGKPKNQYGKVILVSIGAAKTFPPISVDTLVIDEAHHEPAQTYQDLQNRISFSKNLGLTATPKRLDAKSLNYEAIAYQKTFISLVREKWLARPDPVLPQTGLSFELDVRMDDFSDESLCYLDNDSRNDFIAQHWATNSGKYGRTLVFAINREHARRLTESFRAAAPRTTVDYIISGEGNASDREVKVSLFKSGKIDVLINCRIFTEGFDCPDIKTIFLTRPTLSVALYLQMIGRGTRITPAKTSFYLVDFQDCLGRFQHQLITPWILEENTNVTEVHKDHVETTEQKTVSIDLPKFLQEDIELSPVDLELIAGYVLYRHESGREDGFLVHQGDESIFLNAWVDLIEKSNTFGSSDLAVEAVGKYKEMAIKRLPLQGFISAAIALSDMRAEYIRILSAQTISEAEFFIDDAEATTIEFDELRLQFGNIHALLKYTLDELQTDMSWNVVYRNESAQFDVATSELKSIIGLRGFRLRSEIAKIYTDHLLDTHITEFEWERFCFSMLKHDFSNLFLLKSPIKD